MATKKKNTRRFTVKKLDGDMNLTLSYDVDDRVTKGTWSTNDRADIPKSVLREIKSTIEKGFLGEAFVGAELRISVSDI